MVKVDVPDNSCPSLFVSLMKMKVCSLPLRTASSRSARACQFDSVKSPFEPQVLQVDETVTAPQEDERGRRSFKILCCIDTELHASRFFVFCSTLAGLHLEQGLLRCESTTSTGKPPNLCLFCCQLILCCNASVFHNLLPHDGLASCPPAYASQLSTYPSNVCHCKGGSVHDQAF